MNAGSERLALGVAGYLQAVSDLAVELAGAPANADLFRLITEKLR